MNIIDLQNYATKLSFGGLHPKNYREVFECYEMIIDDFRYRQTKLIEKQIETYINKNFVDIKDLKLGDAVFYFSSN